MTNCQKQKRETCLFTYSKAVFIKSLESVPIWFHSNTKKANNEKSLLSMWDVNDKGKALVEGG